MSKERGKKGTLPMGAAPSEQKDPPGRRKKPSVEGAHEWNFGDDADELDEPLELVDEEASPAEMTFDADGASVMAFSSEQMVELSADDHFNPIPVEQVSPLGQPGKKSADMPREKPAQEESLEANLELSFEELGKSKLDSLLDSLEPPKATTLSAPTLSGLDTSDLVMLDGVKEASQVKTELTEEDTSNTWASDNSDVDISELIGEEEEPSLELDTKAKATFKLKPEDEDGEDDPSVSALAAAVQEQMAKEARGKAPALVGKKPSDRAAGKEAAARTQARQDIPRDRGRRYTSGAFGPAKTEIKEPFVLFGGWFGENLRARIAVGFALALVLGSVVPLIYANSVVSSDLAPLLQEQANSQVFVDANIPTKKFRNVEVIKSTVASLRTRNITITMGLWLVLSTGLGVAWYRFT